MYSNYLCGYARTYVRTYESMFDSDDWLHKYIGLKRTGKSCRLRWLNYLRPDVRRGNITPEEQLTIMELHAKWGNRLVLIYKNESIDTNTLRITK